MSVIGTLRWTRHNSNEKRVITGLAAYFSSTLLFNSRPWGTHSSLRVFTAYPELKLSHICLPGFQVFQSQGYKECSFNIAGSFPGLSNVRISGTPSPCYQGDRPAERKSEPIWHQEDASFYLTSLQPSRDAVEVEGVVTPVANQFCANEKMEKIKQDSHIPQATVHSSLVAEAWFAWHSMHRSMMWFLRIAYIRRLEKYLKNWLIPADRTVVHNNIPRPKSHCVPFFHLMWLYLHDFKKGLLPLDNSLDDDHDQQFRQE